MKTLTIGWLNKCRCGNKSHTVKTVRGNDAGLWDDDAVKCNSCGRGGIIQVCEGQARVLWETDEDMAENKPMSTITKGFTKEQLIARINQVTAINKYRISRDPSADGLAMDNELLAIALASLEAEPVCVIDQSNLDYLKSGSDADVWPASRTEMGDVLLYRAAPPAPVFVPTFEQWCERTEQNPVGWVRDAMKEAYDGCRDAMLQGAENAESPSGNSPVIPDEKGSSLQLRNLIRQRHAEWSQATFGDVGPIGTLKHLSKEALEAAAEPNDLSEWADMQFLLWDAQRRAGISDSEITAAMEEKLKVNMARQWPEPKDGEPRLHIKTATLQEVKP